MWVIGFAAIGGVILFLWWRGNPVGALLAFLLFGWFFAYALPAKPESYEWLIYGCAVVAAAAVPYGLRYLKARSKGSSAEYQAVEETFHEQSAPLLREPPTLQLRHF